MAAERVAAIGRGVGAWFQPEPGVYKQQARGSWSSLRANTRRCDLLTAAAATSTTPRVHARHLSTYLFRQRFGESQTLSN